MPQHEEPGSGAPHRDPATTGSDGGKIADKITENGTEKSAEKGVDKSADQGGDRGRERSGEAGGGSAGSGGRADARRSRKPLLIVAAVIIVAAVVALIVWIAHRNEASTDDAYTDGNVVNVAPQVAGYVVDLRVDDNMHVHRGELLVRIDPREFRASLAQAQAQLALAQAQLRSAQDALRIARVQYPAQLAAAEAQAHAAEANLANAERQYLRQHEVDPLATTQENVDATTAQKLSSGANVEGARAQVRIARLVPEQIQQAVDTVAERESQVRQAEAQIAQAELNLGFTEIRAPCDGFVTQRSVQQGQYVAVGTNLFLLVTPEVWVTANFKESQLGRMRIGDQVEMKIDAYSGYRLYGHVQSLQYGSGSRFSAFPAENATGNFVKIVQRVPVKIVIDRGLDPDRPLPLGLSVTPTVHLR
jgi:membrane fusion protein (multidrug efflux system)